MRLWSFHPCYLDAKGLVALWREGLLARKVLQNLTIGYRNHPQLERFKEQVDSIAVIDRYLLVVYEESLRRGYHFDRTKIGPRFSKRKLIVTDGQLKFEFRHLKQKLKERDAERYKTIAAIDCPRPHPIFKVIHGNVEAWEKIG